MTNITDFSFNIDEIDRQLDWGIPLPCVVTLSHEPLIPYELILEQFISTNNPVVYFTTQKNKQTVQKMFKQSEQIDTSINTKIIEIPRDSPINHLEKALEQLSVNNILIVIDSVNILERQPSSKYKSTLRDLHHFANKTDSCVLLIGSNRGNIITENREMTISQSDTFFYVYEEVQGGSDVETFLLVKKNRYGKPISIPFKIELSETIEIDTSRTIS